MYYSSWLSSAGSTSFSLGRRRDKHCVVHRIDNTPLYLDVDIKSINGIEPFRSPNSAASSGCGLDRQCIYFVVLWLENPATAAAAACSSSSSSSSINGSSSSSSSSSICKGAARETNKKLSDSSATNVGWWSPQKFEFRLDPAVFEWEKLKLEVVRIGFGDEIGTSGGKRVVGRASIKIHKVVGGKESSKESSNCQVVGGNNESSNYQVELVRTRVKGSNFECRREGKISMDMKLTREYRFNSEHY